jgi:hypothetical protein
MDIPEALKSPNPMKWLRFFGPGAIVASVTIGSGETIFPSRGGSIFGFSLLWIILVVAVLKWNLAYSSMRHMILSGAHPLERWNCIPGPSGWLHLFILIIAITFYPLVYAFLGGVLGGVLDSIFPNVFGGDGSSHFAWALIGMTAAILLLLSRGYRFLEKVQTLILGLLIIGILVAVFQCGPDWPAAIKGMLIPGPLTYPDWLHDVDPKLARRSVWVEVLVYVSFIGGTGSNYLAYASFLRDKKWGRCHLGPASKDELDSMVGLKDHSARLWLRALRVDTLVSFGVVVVISAAFCILGVELLRPEHLVPAKTELLSLQASFLGSISEYLIPLYWAGVFMAFFGSIYGSPELSHRFVYETINASPRLHGRLNEKMLRLAVIGWCLGGGMIVLWWKQAHPEIRLVELITPSSICLGTVLCGIYALANPFMDNKFLPKPLRMSPIMAGLNLTAGLAFLAAAIRAFLKMDAVNGIIIACMLGISLLLAHLTGVWGEPIQTRENISPGD